MFAVESRAVSLCACFARRKFRSRDKVGLHMDSKPASQDPRLLICRVLADMPPSTAEEIAQATGLDPETAAGHLDKLAAAYRIMFNPLTKRFSLPKARPAAGMAA
ncbi:hypothetical protein AAFN88_16035 [Pelagibius sp. CAU 1746]|uniref:hypothetical protein n=1 Tax=Pelagibius sp. CAU 1746 TaxID=3140370 RepID=UPI00325B3F0A